MYWNKRIKDLREDNDLTKQELADKLDISERTLTRYETGESEPTISVLIKMSLIFNVSLDIYAYFFILISSAYLRMIEQF